MQLLKNYYLYFLLIKKKGWVISNNDLDIIIFDMLGVASIMPLLQFY